MKYKDFLLRTGVVFSLATVLLAGGWAGQAGASSEAITKAVSYLQGQSDSAGKVLALSAAGESSSVEFLKSFSGSDAINYAKPIMALTVVGEDPRTYPDENWVEKLKGFESEGQIGSPGALNDNFWGILALRSAGVPTGDSLLESAKQFIIENQNSDGGWGWSVGGGSDTDNTAAAVMALLEMDLSSGNSVIESAIDYIKENQNDDGGFASDPTQSWGVDSNTASTAWVVAMINKLGESPESWAKNENNPIDFILSLQDEGGGFWWVEEGDNKMSTADVLVGLTGETFPINKITPPAEGGGEGDEDGSEDEGGNQGEESQAKTTLRIEGSDSQICKIEIEALNALDIVEEASTVCGYSFNIAETDFGLYLNAINDDVAEGMDGWLYHVNWLSPSFGADQYELSEGDYVLWHYGSWTWKPMKLSLDNASSLSQGDTLSGKIESVSDGVWSPVEGAEISFAGETFLTQSDGSFSIELAQNGVFEILAEKDGFIRTDTHSVVVGASSGSVALSVEIVEDDELDPEIGFKLSNSALSFGALAPGGSTSQTLGIENTGQQDLNLSAEVTGHQIFNLLNIGGSLWSVFESFLAKDTEENFDLSLSVPSEFDSYGDKSGELIIWGSASQ